MNTENKKSYRKEDEVILLENFIKENYELRYNEVLDRDEIRSKGEKSYKTMTEQYIAILELDVIKAGLKRNRSLLRTLLTSRTLSESYNPFRSYFDSIRPLWKEGDKDYIGELFAYLTFKNHTDQAYIGFIKKMFEKHLVRTVACALRYIPFNKQCFVLQGGQSAGKSYFFRWLCPDYLSTDYYKENLQFDHKDSTIALSENYMINLDELDGLEKQDASRIKTLISQDNFKVRRNYGVRDEKLVRYASFYGSINDVEFLNDLTGNVRWLVFELAEIFHDNGGEQGYAKKIDKNMVWAQALALSENPEYKCQLTKDEEGQINRHNRKYLKTPIEADLLDRYFEPTNQDDKESFSLTASAILIAINKIEKSVIRLSPERLGKALTFLGFQKHSKRINGQNPKYYYSVRVKTNSIIEYLPESPYYPTTNKDNGI